jgi:5-methylcytosine-specific restriction enzyme A
MNFKSRRSDPRSEAAAAWRGWYKLARWCGKKGRRARQLAREPLCRYCLQHGIVNDGSRTMAGDWQPDRRRRYLVADHVIPHKGDPVLFWQGELQTLCPDHHDSVKQQEEVQGFSSEVGNDGWPIDPNHPANR